MGCWAAAGRRGLFLVAVAVLLAGCELQPQPRPTPSAPLTGPGPSTAAAPEPTPAPVPEPAVAQPVADAAARAAEVAARVALVQEWLTATQRGAVLLAEPGNVAWLTLGASLAAPPGRPAGVLAVLPREVLVVAPADTIDSARAAVAEFGWSGRTYRWDLGADPAAPVRAVAPLAGGAALGSDVRRSGADYVADAIAGLRRGLRAAEVAGWQALGATLRAAAGRAAAAVATSTEREVAALLAAEPGLPADAWIRVVALDRWATDGLAAPSDAPVAAGAVLQLVASREGYTATYGTTLLPPGVAEPPAAVGHDWALAQRLLAAAEGVAAPAAGPLNAVYAAAAREAGSLAAGEAFPKIFLGGLGAGDPARWPLAAESAAVLRAGDVLTAEARLPRAYAATAWYLGGAEDGVGAPAEPPVLVGAPEVVAAVGAAAAEELAIERQRAWLAELAAVAAGAMGAGES